MLVLCHRCSKKFAQYASRVKKNKYNFCTKKCYMEWRIGPNNPQWKGERITADGYKIITVYDRGRYPCGKRKEILVHRLVMEKYLGRHLEEWEVVHHINGDKLDNRIENLKLLPGIEHNKRIQEIYKENQMLWSRISSPLDTLA